MGKKKGRKRNTGWARTKDYPHERHPANYRRINGGNDIEYITFTHSSDIELRSGKMIVTIPMNDNISPKEREENKRKNDNEKKKSYGYPVVFVGERSALGKEDDDFKPIKSDKEKIKKMFETLPKENVYITGGENHFKKKKKPRKK